MNYIELINHFWQTRRTKAFSSNEADLYFALLQECNIRGWQNPFECSNRSIIATIGITEKGLIEVRNRLQVKGLIKFEKGKRKEKSPVYTLLYCNEVSINVSKTVSIKVSKKVSKKVHSFKTETETKTETNNIPLYPLKGENVSIPKIKILDSENEEKEKKVPAKKEKDFFDFKKSLLSLGISENLVKDWLIVRKNKKMSNTETAFEKIESQLKQSPLSFNESIKIAIEKSWGGFNAKWIENELKNNYDDRTNSNTQQSSNRFDNKNRQSSSRVDAEERKRSVSDFAELAEAILQQPNS